VEYLLLQGGEDRTLLSFDGMRCVRIAGEGAARYVFLPREDSRGAGLLHSYLPDAAQQTLVVDPAGQAWAIALDQPAGGRFDLPEMTPLPVQLSDGIELLGYWLSDAALRPDNVLYVRLFWRATATPSTDYTTFAHLLTVEPDAAPAQAAGSDSQPGGGSCHTASWRAGETIVDELQIMVPADLPAAQYTLAVGFYELASGQRLAIPGYADDQVLLAPISPRH
jgi:hypothetical protein